MTNQAASQKAVGYIRVSTARQKKHAISLADQAARIREYCASRGIELIGIYEDANSGRRADRPGLTKMLCDAHAKPRPFDLILIYSRSRLFRDAAAIGACEGKLERRGIRIVAVTLDVDDSPEGRLTKNMVSALDQYQSEVHGQRVADVMVANAKAGFWNGATPPLGYKTVVAEVLGDKPKKRLEIDEAQAELVRLIFRLRRYGEDGSGPMGVKKIASRLNAQGRRTPDGGHFSVGYIHQVLTRHTYIGQHFYNTRDSRTGLPRPREEWVEVMVPPIVSVEDFEAVQVLLRESSPKVTPPRTVSGPTLLTQVAVCPHCGSALTLTTGKSGRYKYYSCSRQGRQGQTGCPGRRIGMEVLDELVIEYLIERLVTPERVTRVVPMLLDRLIGENISLAETIKSLRIQLSHVRTQAANLVRSLTTDPELAADPEFRELRGKLQWKRSRLEADIRAAENRRIAAPMKPTPERVAAMIELLRDRLRRGPVAFRRAMLGLFVERIVVGEEVIEVIGRHGEALAA